MYYVQQEPYFFFARTIVQKLTYLSLKLEKEKKGNVKIICLKRNINEKTHANCTLPHCKGKLTAIVACLIIKLFKHIIAYDTCFEQISSYRRKQTNVEGNRYFHVSYLILFKSFITDRYFIADF